ncbi:Wzz/FepE/Etk N-terminal domain-containing protein [Falsiroseomonas sp.]|uniref:GumC family protein n=1 Tax=Falsiroseomonas sp. TaxID=2870721 RepID=UPI0027350977|nr:Wzz/FepE/Etk N-terminal domain-containing protein [Falsiroseomonas sp.]
MDSTPYAMLLDHKPSDVSLAGHRERIAANTFMSIWRRRYVIVLVVLLALGAAIATLLLMPRTYSSEAVIQLELAHRASARPTSASGPTVVLDPSALVQNEARILRGRPLMRSVVEELGLAEQPPAPGRLATLISYLPSEMAGQITQLVERLQPSPGGPEAAELRREQAIRDIVSRLSVSTDNRSYLVSISYRADDPEVAARVANVVAETYLRREVLERRESAERRTAWIDEQIQQTSGDLERVRAEIAEFRQRTNILEPGRGGAAGDAENVAQQQLRTLTSQLNAAILARMNEERRLSRVQEIVAAGGTPSASDVQGQPLIGALLERELVARRDLGQLQTRLGSQHPRVAEAAAGLGEVRSRLAAESRRAIEIARADLAAAQRTEADLTASLQRLQREMIEAKPDETALQALQAGAQETQERLAALVRNRQQALADAAIAPPSAFLVMPAEPVRAATSPRPTIVMLIGLAGGGILGIGLGLLLERRDLGVRTSSDIEEAGGPRCLGMVPSLPSREVAAIANEASYNAAAMPMFREAIRSVGASVGLFDAARGCRLVLVTSAMPGEGKSTVCAALACALGSSGRRVMLIDGVPGRPDVQPVEPAAFSNGSEVVPARQDDGTAQNAMVVIRRRASLRAGADVFGTDRFRALIDEASKQFDVIIIEGAPVMLVADSLVLGRLVDTVIQVVRWSDTKKSILNASLKRMRDHGVAVDGIVVTRVNLRRHAALRFMDQCSFYVKERRFYERLAGKGRA